MRTRPLTMLTAAAAVALVVVAACEAKVQAKAYSAADRAASHYREQPQQPLVELLLRTVAPPAAPDVLPNAGLSGVQERIQQATDEAAAKGAILSIAVLDRATRRLVSNGSASIIATASVSKLFIADELLLRESEGKATLSPEDHQALDGMLRSSDDGAAERFWSQLGGDAVITAVATRYGLTSTVPPSDGRWWNTLSSTSDLIRYYEMLLDGTGGLPLERAGLMVNDLAQSTPTGIDGYPQRFGIPDGLYAEPVAVKQGWMCCIGADWMHLSTGVIGSDRRYIMVIESLQPSDETIARETITQAVRTIFPHGRI
ncbi:serine hydrolase [Mycobacterium simiae]|uniref:Serine hydrolase n=1 Tax=Mycobacterium simiae TaxID=1784 RepID=A0A5B1BUU6_MYCSI|nr:serine hydrolase [Mycobacterium simiae]KAA1251761.1 serine hydrolase [Mycobacterium simiae]